MMMIIIIIICYHLMVDVDLYKLCNFAIATAYQSL